MIENINAEHTQLFAWMPFLFGLGIAFYFSLPSEPNPWLVLGVIEIWLLLFYIFRFKNLNLLFISGLIIICGFVNIQMRTIYQSERIRFEPKQITYLSGQITDITYSDKAKQRFTIRNAHTWDKPLTGLYRITNTGTQEAFKPGECIELIATVFPPSRLPLLEGFQLDRKYFYEDISGIGYANSEIFSVKCQKTTSLGFKTYFNQIRHHISQKISKLLPPSTAGIADALLIGEKSQIPPQIVDHYRGSGLAHFLAVSGLHIGSIAGLVFFLVRLLLAFFPSIALRINNKKPAAIIAILVSALYLMISGMAIPAERAFIMTTTILIGIFFDRQAISLRMVSFAALIILIIMPQALISISFQMSFAAVYALVAFYEKFSFSYKKSNSIQHWYSRLWWYLSGIIIADLIASLATAPMAVYHFKQLAIYTSLGNLLAGPIIGFYLIPMILLCLLTLPFGIANWPIKGLGMGLEVLNNLTAKIAALPDSLLNMPDMPLWSFLLIIFGAYWLCVWQKQWRFWGLIPIFCAFIPLFLAQKPVMLIAPDNSGIAIRDNRSDMILFPIKTDSWLKKIWQNRWKIQTLYKDEYTISDDGCLDLPKTLDLKCSNGTYTFRNQVHFIPQKTLKIKDKNIDCQTGGYIYEKNNNFTFVPLWNNKKCRYWQSNYKQCSKH